MSESLFFARQGLAVAEQLGAPEYQMGAASQFAQTALQLGCLTELQALAERAEGWMANGDLLGTTMYEICAMVWAALKQPQHARRNAQAAVANTSDSRSLSLENAEVLWIAAAVLAETDGSRTAQPIRERAYTYLLNKLTRLTSPTLRRALLSSTRELRALAQFRSAGNSRLVSLPAQSSPTGRPLAAQEMIPVVWTLHASGDALLTIAEGRRGRLVRLASEAVEQGAHATVEALADVLAVSERTVMRDLESLRQVGITIQTRGTARKRKSKPSP